jgi:hypothetical protein
MSEEAVKTLTHAFISSQLDYGLGRREHITPVLRQLHWLPVRQRVRFKLATLVHRALAGTAPAYLSDECHLSSSAAGRCLRSADTRSCVLRRPHNTFGERCFAAAGPSVWNSLPPQLRQPDITFNRFKTLLKTFLFGWRDHGALRRTVKSAAYKYSYLLTYLFTLVFTG